MFSLESPQRYINIYKKENHPKLSQTCNHGICSKGPKNEFEQAVVNEPSVFEPLKFYCIWSEMCSLTTPYQGINAYIINSLITKPVVPKSAPIKRKFSKIRYM